jgi:hypothetical protein
MTAEPKWLTALRAATAAACERILRGDPPPCEHRSCRNAGYAMCLGVAGAQLDMVHAEDEQNPARICAWCFHPRNSDECQFAAMHVPYREMFTG